MEFQADQYWITSLGGSDFYADSIHHPYSEYRMLIIKYGFAGLLLVLGVVYYMLRSAIRSKTEESISFVCALIATLVICWFSTPSVCTWFLPLVVVYMLYWFAVSVRQIDSIVIPTKFRLVAVSLLTIALLGCFSRMQIVKEWQKCQHEENIDDYTYTKLNKTWLTNNPYFLYEYGYRLNRQEEFAESNKILLRAKRYMADYDLEMLIADNHYKMEEYQSSILHYHHALQMIPNRMEARFRLFESYLKASQIEDAMMVAEEIVNITPKVESLSTKYYQDRCREWIEQQSASTE